MTDLTTLAPTCGSSDTAAPFADNLPNKVDGVECSNELSKPRKPPTPPPQRHRWIFFFAIRGDLRFISHHDTMRLFRRALARAALPVRFSQGFNPQPRISLPLPRPVGVASEAEAAVIEFDHAIDAEEAIDRLRKAAPPGLVFMGIRPLPSSASPQAESVRYGLSLPGVVSPELNERIRSVMDSATLPIQRKNHKTGKVSTFDVRPYLREISAVETGVEFMISMLNGVGPKPSEIAALLHCGDGPINHRVRRLVINWNFS